MDVFHIFPKRAISAPRHNGRVGFNSKAGQLYKTYLKKSATVLIKHDALSAKGCT